MPTRKKPKLQQQVAIDPKKRPHRRARQALKAAQDAGLLDYRMAADLSDPEEIKALSGHLGAGFPLPDDGGEYYLIYVTNQAKQQVPILISDDMDGRDALAMTLVAAAQHSTEVLAKVTYRQGMVIVPAPEDPDQPLGIDANKPMHTRSRHALMVGHEAGLFRYRFPTDLSDPLQVDRLVGELSPDFPLPEDGGQHYLIYVTNKAGVQVPILIPDHREGQDALAMALFLAAQDSDETLAKVTYRQGMVAVPEPPEAG